MSVEHSHLLSPQQIKELCGILHKQGFTLLLARLWAADIKLSLERVVFT